MAPVAGPRRDAPPGGLDGDDPSALPVSQHADAIVAAVRANPIVVVIGETGSGKTTLLNIAGALLEPSNGQVLFSGELLTGRGDLAAHRLQNVGFVFQDFH